MAEVKKTSEMTGQQRKDYFHSHAGGDVYCHGFTDTNRDLSEIDNAIAALTEARENLSKQWNIYGQGTHENAAELGSMRRSLREFERYLNGSNRFIAQPKQTARELLDEIIERFDSDFQIYNPTRRKLW